MKLVCAATVALMLATSATAASCTTDQEKTIKNFMAAYVSTPCTANSMWMSVMSFENALRSEEYLMCQPPCKDDLQNLTSSIPNCVDTAGTHAKIDQLKQLCIKMTRPTTNGGECTSADSILFDGLKFNERVWLNCSSVKNKNLYDLQARTAEDARGQCASSTYTAFINSIAKLMLNCVDKYGENMMDYKADDAMLWYNCSTFLNYEETKTFWDLGNLLYRRKDLPSGFCASTCPANYLSTIKKLPSCDEYGTILNDPSHLYSICPNLKPAPTPAPTPAPALTCPLPGSYRATGMRVDLANSGAFTESHDGSGNTCSTTGTYAISGPMATFTVATVSGVCSNVFTANAKLSGPISFSTDCNQLTLNYTGTPSTLQRTSNAETAATSAMLLLGVFLAWGAL
ncbi:hypothetical protein SPRG_12776 [Saprolegnia parasitica CBS 223.65]|uniref:Secreted protein n=1 Tax=Saprolegnia parasitica (strain CBS 223.65) TaxID=695850 RepID=A0A067BUX7_SAPPC|nr:hypothetical protein SPRG_12776 [Saprolegnia parasitica CBS 223.65]KDO22314.1 hypothetical protein SPRG_12776 [Saprolegnia parasitica CBS 223.65]|eukprot:XP_012206950.1 hypothetical protein SPRG_12776 [Saprolegnia parasitica CBS 223.65]